MIIHAKYALVAPGKVRNDVRLEVDGQRIVALNSGYVPVMLRPDFDFGDAVITPGFTNAHSHLELEFCAGQTPFNGNFFKWLQSIRDLKHTRNNKGTHIPRDSLKALASCGCTTVLDHHATDMDWSAIEGFGLRYIPFREYFQFNNHHPDPARMSALAQSSFAPHAPYTASLEVAKVCRGLADQAGLPLSMHLSEVPEEIAFIRDGSGKGIRQLLAVAGADDETWQGCGMSPVRYYAGNGILNGPTYAVHVNYLEPGDIGLLADLKPTVVFCPRSHQFFGHTQHPITEFIKAGIPVALGTDSLASNDRLSPLYEAMLVRERYPEVTAEDVFSAITTRGLEPLGWATRLGRLYPGCLADFAVFPLKGDPGPDFDALFDAVIDTGKSALTIIGGEVVSSSIAETVEEISQH